MTSKVLVKGEELASKHFAENRLPNDFLMSRMEIDQVTAFTKKAGEDYVKDKFICRN